MKKAISILCFLLALATNCFSQSKDDEARLLYKKADETYNQIQYRNRMKDKTADYTEVITNLNEAIKRVGFTPKIDYLFIKADYDALSQKVFLQNKEHYDLILKVIDSLFAKIDNNYPKEKANEIIRIKLDVQNKLKNLRAFTSREDAFNLIAKTIKKYPSFPGELLNITWDGKNKIEIVGKTAADYSNNGYCYYYAYQMNISSLQPLNDDGAYDGESKYRINHYFIFPEHNGNSYIAFTTDNSFRIPNSKEINETTTMNDLSKYFKKHKHNEHGDQDEQEFDIFFDSFKRFINNVFISYESPLAFMDKKKENINQAFYDEAEDDYLKAWIYLYNTSKQ